MWSVTVKVPKWPESLPYQKKDGRAQDLFFFGKVGVKRAHPSFGMTLTQAIRGRPLMIWGGPKEKSKMDLFFPLECLLRIIFSWRKPLEIFSWGRPFEIYFFPGEGPPRYFFSQFPPGLPPDH